LLILGLDPGSLHTGYGVVALELRRQPFGQKALDHIRVDAEVHKQPALDDSPDRRHEHDSQYGFWLQF